MKKEFKNKVGRPKLADDKLKFESIIVCIFIIVMCIAITFASFKILSIQFGTKDLQGSILNDHINSCVISGNSLDCGPNVIYLKYSINNSDYKEVYKEDKPINVVINNQEIINYCYKTSKTDLICNK